MNTDLFQRVSDDSQTSYLSSFKFMNLLISVGDNEVLVAVQKTGKCHPTRSLHLLIRCGFQESVGLMYDLTSSSSGSGLLASRSTT